MSSFALVGPMPSGSGSMFLTANSWDAAIGETVIWLRNEFGTAVNIRLGLSTRTQFSIFANHNVFIVRMVGE